MILNLLKFLKRKECIVAAVMVFALTLGNFALFSQDCQALRTEVIRLHILANSDTSLDQTIKLKVRDNILKATGSIFAQPGTKADAIQAAKDALPQIEQIAQATLLENGFAPSAKAEFRSMYFNTRHYDDYTLPAGVYDAIRVTLGNGDGKNWWCVLYPPICVPAATPSDSPLVEDIEALDAQPMLVPKLAVVEVLESVKNKLFPAPATQENAAMQKPTERTAPLTHSNTAAGVQEAAAR